MKSVCNNHPQLSPVGQNSTRGQNSAPIPVKRAIICFVLVKLESHNAYDGDRADQSGYAETERKKLWIIYVLTGLLVILGLLTASSTYHARQLRFDGMVEVLKAAKSKSIKAPRDKRLLVGGLSGWIEFDSRTGDYVGVFAPSTSNSDISSNLLWGVDSLLQRMDGSLLVPTYYVDPNSDLSGPSAILLLDRQGSIERRWDRPAGSDGKAYTLRRAYGLAMVSGALYSAAPRLVVAGLGNDALALFDPDTGLFLDWLAQGDNTTASPMGPNDVLQYKQDTLFFTTEGSYRDPTTEQIVFPSYLNSALLSVNLNTRKITVVDVPSPAPGSSGFVSLLGLDYVPSATFYSSSYKRKGEKRLHWGDYSKGSSKGKNGKGGGGGVLLVVSDFAGGLRYYDPETYELVQTIDTSFFNPYTGANTTFYYGHLRVYRGHLYLAAYDYIDPALSGYLLRYTLNGQPAGLVGNTPIFIGPSVEIGRAIGVDFIF
eukprot:g35783.t1